MTSKLKTDVLETVSGSGTIALTNQLSGMTSASVPSGSVIQVVSVTKTDTFSTTSGSYVDLTGLSVSITPSSTSSKILITGSVCWGTSDVVPYQMFFKLVRDSTSIGIADADGNRSRCTFGAQGIYQTDSVHYAPINFLDTPSTISATVYKIQCYAEGGRTLWINRGAESDGNNSVTARFTSSITVQEIKG